MRLATLSNRRAAAKAAREAARVVAEGAAHEDAGVDWGENTVPVSRFGGCYCAMRGNTCANVSIL